MTANVRELHTLFPLTPPESNRVRELYETSYKLLYHWVAGNNLKEAKLKLTAPDGPFGKRTLEERAQILLPDREINNDLLDFDEKEVPGTWRWDLTDHQVIFEPLTPANHLYLAHLDARAARGLVARVPRLGFALAKSGLTIEEGQYPVALAAFGALDAAEVEAFILQPMKFKEKTILTAYLTYLSIGTLALTTLDKIEDITNQLKNRLRKKS